MQILKVIQNHGYTLEQVATMLGITKGSLSATINGSPNVKKLIDIALKIGCSPAEFFDDWYENEGKEQQRPFIEPAVIQPEAPKTEASPADALPFTATETQQIGQQAPVVPASLICPHCGGAFVIEVKGK